MKSPLRITILWFLGIASGVAEPVSGTLYLGEAPGENEVTLELSAFSFTSTRTTIYSGSIDVEMEVDLEAHAVTGFQMIGGEIETTDCSFLFESPFIFSQTVDTIDYQAVPLSLNGFESFAAPGVFDANEHVFFFNEGRTVSDGTFGASETLVKDGPFNAAGITTGLITLANPQSENSTLSGAEMSVSYDVNFSVSLDSRSYPDPDDQSSYVDTSGTVTAGGQVVIYTHPFYEWAALCFPEAGNALSFTADANRDGEMDGLSWALGQPVGFQEPLPMVFQKEERQFQLEVSEAGTRAPITIQTSSTLAPGSWVDVADGDLSSGANPIPTGTKETVIVSFSDASTAFYRLLTVKE